MKIEPTGDEFVDKALYYNNIPLDDSLRQICCTPLVTAVTDQPLSLLFSPGCATIPDTTSSCVSSSSTVEVDNTRMVDLLIETEEQRQISQIEPKSSLNDCSKVPEFEISSSMDMNSVNTGEEIDYEDNELINFLEQTFEF